MIHFTDFSKLDAKYDQLIVALFRCRTKREAARACGISVPTMYRWLRDPRFQEAFRLARRDAFDDGMFIVEKNASVAAQALVDELGEDRKACPHLINAAKAILDRAFKAQTMIAIEEEMSKLRAIIAALRAGQAPAPPAENLPEVLSAMPNANEQAEAALLRVAWMAEIGMGGHEIEASLRYNRPQSVAEEQQLLDVVRATLEFESKHNEAMNALAHSSDGILGQVSV